MREYYPLTAAQKMHHNWIVDYGTQQVSGVSVVASVQAELDFGLLKKCIQMEIERSGCTRVRFTKPDQEGNVKQYIVKQDSRDIELKDLSGMGNLAEADELMQQWAYETFDGDNIPMCEFTMLKLPEGYNGFFVHMDHRLIDSCGLVVMIGDLFQLYTYYKYGTAYPQELADFQTVLKKDLAKAGNEKRFAKDKKFCLIMIGKVHSTILCMRYGQIHFLGCCTICKPFGMLANSSKHFIFHFYRHGLIRQLKLVCSGVLYLFLISSIISAGS